MEMTFRGSWSSRSIRGTTAMPKPRAARPATTSISSVSQEMRGRAWSWPNRASTVSRIPEPLEKET